MAFWREEHQDRELTWAAKVRAVIFPKALLEEEHERLSMRQQLEQPYPMTSDFR